MSDLNNYSFTGRLGADAELKFLQAGTPVWNARVGVGYGYGDRKGTNWISVQVFGKRAEGLGKLELVKGAQVGISGELRIREYTKNDGTKGYAHEVVTNDVTLLGSKPASDSPRSQAPARSKQGAPADDFVDDDVPF